MITARAHRTFVRMKRALRGSLALLAIAALQLAAGAAHACMFASDTKPAEWFEWSSALFSGDVTNFKEDPAKALDIITVRVDETFKGPENAAVATLQVPLRMWTSCRLVRPAVGDHVLVGLNPNGDTLVVLLTDAFAERLRAQRGKMRIEQ
jgi:hypothetical protein